MKISIKQYNEIKNKNVKLSISSTVKQDKSSRNYNNSIIDSISSSKIYFSFENNELTLLFLGARLFTTNKIFALLQSQKYVVFKYKKLWHNKVATALNLINEKYNNIKFDRIDIELLRSAPRLVDEDAMMTMFKYIIDGLKYNKNENSNGILFDDNKNYISNIFCHNIKGVYAVGLKIKASRTEEAIMLENFIKIDEHLD